MLQQSLRIRIKYIQLELQLLSTLNPVSAFSNKETAKYHLRIELLCVLFLCLYVSHSPKLATKYFTMPIQSFNLLAPILW